MNDEVLSWKALLKDEKNKEYFKNILTFIEQERARGKIIYPSNNDIFAAFSLTSLAALKVVILGQDPYHGPGQAHGLSFSVPEGTPKPPSLQNIFLELKNDLGVPMPTSGNLENWAKQGVLLLNSFLSVEAGLPGSHAKLGWDTFTDSVIKKISDAKTGVVFLLWGSFAQKKSTLIDQSRHHILTAPHPSPLSAHRGFLGCKAFSKTNEILLKNNQEIIHW